MIIQKECSRGEVQQIFESKNGNKRNIIENLSLEVCIVFKQDHFVGNLLQNFTPYWKNAWHSFLKYHDNMEYQQSFNFVQILEGVLK